MPRVYTKSLDIRMCFVKLLVTGVVLLAIASPHAQPQSITAEQPATDSHSTALPLLSTSVTSDRKQAYVSEQVLISVDVLVPDSAFNLRQEKLTVSGADVYTLFKTSSNTVHKDQPYQRVSTSYALFFKRPGTYRVPSLKISAMLPVSAGGAGATNNPRISSSSKPLALAINAAPATATNWLAALDVTAQSQWQFEGKNRSFVAGQPVTRRFDVQISGQFPTAIPTPGYSVPDGIRLYISPPQTEKHHDKSGVRGTLTQVITVIPNSAGVYQIPSLKIDWWDIAHQRWKQTKIAAETINVQPSPFARSGHSLLNWKFLLLMAVTTTVVSALGSGFYFRRKRTGASFQATPPNEQQAWFTVKNALRNKNPHKVRSTVVKWYSAINKTNTTFRIEQIGEGDAELQEIFKQLDASIYSNSGNKKIDYRALRARLRSLRRQLKLKTGTNQSRNKNESTGLLDLYPVRGKYSN